MTAKDPARSSRDFGHGKHAALVDDDRFARKAAVRMLESLGLSVLAFESAAAAIAALRQGQPQIDLLVTDVMLKDMTGFDLIRRLSEYARPPVLFVSGYPKELIDDAPIDAEFLLKPYTTNELRNAVERVLAG